MKKLTRILFILLCAAVMAFSLVACSSAEPEYKLSDPSTFTISVESVEEKLEQFMDGRVDRTTYSENERKAAEYLRDTLVGYGYVDGEVAAETEDAPDGGADDNNAVDTIGTGMIREFTTKEQVTAANGSTTTVERKSQNVVALYAPDGLEQNHKNVIIGAYYDNRYSSQSGTVGARSTGALSNGTGVAALLAISEYLQVEKPQLEFSVTIVFFGASALNNVGVTKFYEQMSADEKTRTVLMIELQRLGVDHVYAYSDSRETKREAFFDGVAEKSGLDIYKVTQKSPTISGATALNGIPFYQWAMGGNFSVFFNHNIPTLNLVGANWETFGFIDNESADNDDIELTENDTLENLKKLYPDYGEKIATAATLVVNGFTEPDFISTMEYDCENFPDTDILLKNWIWYLVALGVVFIAGAVMTLISSHLAKKYPVVAPAPRKVKMAVFGMDYEDKKDDEIYIDIRPPQQEEEIFPGVPNNDDAVGFGNPNDPFPTYPPMPDNAEQKKEESPKDDVSEVFDLEPKKEEPDVKPETSDAAETEHKESEPKEEAVDSHTDAAEASEEAKDDIVKGEAPAVKKTVKKTPTKSAATNTAPKKRTSSTKKPIKSDKVDAAGEKPDNE